MKTPRKPAQSPKNTPESLTMSVTPANSFAGATGALSGLDALFSNDGQPQYSVLPLDLIFAKTQVREQFEDEDNSLAELAESIKVHGVMQPIVVRAVDDGRYEIIAGERRFRASTLAGLHTIPAMLREMSDEEAEEAQFAENVQRKNLTQIEEAKKVQRDLDKAGGDIDAILSKYNKSRAWLSKLLALLTLPEQARRLLSENISADVEVINTVKTVERIDPEKARELVDELKTTRGKENARDKATAVKEQVKPGKPGKTAKPGADRQAGTTTATPRDRAQEAPSQGKTLAPGKSTRPAEAFSPARALNEAYTKIFENGARPQAVLDAIGAQHLPAIESHLLGFYDEGKKTKSAGRNVMQGLRQGTFATDGDGAFALLAFLQGAEVGSSFSMLDILAAAR